MPPRRNPSSSNPIPTPPVIPPEPPSRSTNEPTHQSAASGSTEPYTPKEENPVPPGLLARQRPAPDESDIEPGEHDEDATVEVRMAIVWHAERITNQTRRTQIIAKARGLVADFVEGHGKYKETPTKARDDMVVATATEMAKAYTKRRAAKTLSTESTPMHFGGNYLTLAGSALGLYEDTPVPVTDRDPPGETTTQVKREYPRSDEGQGEQQNTSTTTGDTRRTFHQPAPAEWRN